MLVFQAPTWQMNPTITRESLQEEFDKDSAFAMMEWGAEFADVVDAFFISDKVVACVDKKRPNILPHASSRTRYVVTLDPGLKGNAYALAMGHFEKPKVIADYLRLWQGTRENPVQIVEVEDFLLGLNRKYRIVDNALDQHQSAATIQRLQKKIHIRETVFTASYNVEIYQCLLELVNMGHFRAPVYEPLTTEMKFLQRIQLSNRFRVEPAQGYTADLADCVANLSYILVVEHEKGGGVFVP
ncbi:MAG: hypothetical protein HWN68_02200 [Desulfobacterales bacterium]|nr:hypothetical protein [Desulfobacterales bacterium]